MFDFENLDYYELLGVPRTATVEEIKRAFRREISKYHPDRYVNAPPEDQVYAERRSQQLTEAHAVLTDFASRNAYNRGQLQPNSVRRGSTPRPVVAPTPRDHQAALYEQAQSHLEAGRTLQAIGVLRQLQQLNPFYRDSAEMLARAEVDLQTQEAALRPEKPARRGPPIWVVAGGAVGAAALLAAAFLFGNRQNTVSTNAATNAPTVATVPTLVPATTMPTPEPTPEPTVVPTNPPPTPEPTLIPPTVPPTLTPAAIDGQVLLQDGFDTLRWANISGTGWSVGYENQQYRINAAPGVGTIWSFRSGFGDPNFSMAADVVVASGAGGLLLRFADDNNYLSFVVDPANATYRLFQFIGGTPTELINGTSETIIRDAGAVNRVQARMKGDTITLLANGQILTNVPLTTPIYGSNYGLLVLAEQTTADVTFDNVEIRAVE